MPELNLFSVIMENTLIFASDLKKPPKHRWYTLQILTAV